MTPAELYLNRSIAHTRARAFRQGALDADLAMAALGGESPGRPAGGSVKGSIDAEVSARVGGGVGASPRGGVPSPKRALRTIGR